MQPFYKNRLFAACVYTLLGLLIFYMLLQIRPILTGVYLFLKAVLMPFVLAMIIAYVLNPIVSLLNRRKVPRPVAVLLIYAIFLASTAIILMNLIPMFVAQLNELNAYMPTLMVKAQQLIDTLNDNRYMPESVRKGIHQSLARFEAGISHAISGYIGRIGTTLNFLFVLFIVPFLAFYILKDYRLFERAALAFVPKSHRRRTTQLLVDIDTALGNYIRGQFLVSVIVGLLAYIGYWAIGMQYPLLLASVVAVCNIIPYIGPYLGAAPALLMAAAISWKMMLYIVIVNTIVQILESNVISPQVVGRTLHMHPLFIMFALLAGGEFAGVAGLILAVPVFAVVKVIVQHISLYYIDRRKT